MCVHVSGKVSVGIVTSPESLKDPSKLAKHWGASWKEMQQAVDSAESEGRLHLPPPRPVPWRSVAIMGTGVLSCGMMAWLTISFFKSAPAYFYYLMVEVTHIDESCRI